MGYAVEILPLSTRFPVYTAPSIKLTFAVPPLPIRVLGQPIQFDLSKFPEIFVTAPHF